MIRYTLLHLYHSCEKEQQAIVQKLNRIMTNQANIYRPLLQEHQLLSWGSLEYHLHSKVRQILSKQVKLSGRKKHDFINSTINIDVKKGDTVDINDICDEVST